MSGVVLVYSVLVTVRWASRAGRRRNPLTRNLLRSPGHSLRNQVDDLSLDILADAGGAMTISCFGALGFAVIDHQGGGLWVHGTVAVVFAGTLTILMIRLARNFRRRQALRLGLDAEMAAGEELNQLMLRGSRVFHDFPADSFNIDHVVVSRRGVFAIETKARAKPQRGRGRDGAVVTYDGERLIFPGWEERAALEQARRQAAWLGKWLTSAVGEPVTAHAALALPGWFVAADGLQSEERGLLGGANRWKGAPWLDDPAHRAPDRATLSGCGTAGTSPAVTRALDIGHRQPRTTCAHRSVTSGPASVAHVLLGTRCTDTRGRNQDIAPIRLECWSGAA